MGNGGTGGDGDTAGTGSIEPGGSVRFNLFFDIYIVEVEHLPLTILYTHECIAYCECPR